MLGDHAHGDEVELPIGPVVLQHALGALVHDLVFEDVVARIDADQEAAGRGEMARALRVGREHPAPAAHIQPVGVGTDQVEECRFVPIVRAAVAKALTQDRGPAAKRRGRRI